MQSASGFLPYCTVIQSRQPRERSCFVLHGALGTGNNFRSIARALSEARPQTEFCLVDLRLHGRSQGAPGPHNLKAAAEDLVRLARERGRAPEVVIGHSFGGKVALAYASQSGDELEQVWVLDSDPGASGPQSADPEVVQVLTQLARVPGPLPSREAAIEALQARGISAPTARWLAGNYERRNAGYVLKLDIAALKELLADYFQTDFWPYLAEHRQRPHVHLVIAERSDRLGPQIRRKAEALGSSTRTRTHVLADAGHWLHVDNPSGLVALILQHFREKTAAH